MYDFSKNKDKIHFIEKNDYIGGRVKSVKSNSSIFEIGSQFFCKSDTNIWELINRKILNDDLVKLDFSNVSFFYKNKLICDIDTIVDVVNNIIEKSKKQDKVRYFDEWFIKNFDKENLFIPKGIIRAITFSDSSEILANYGTYILETFFDECFTLKNGLEEIINSLSRNINIENKTVQKFIFKKNRLSSMITDKGVMKINEDIVISTAPVGDIKICGHAALKKNLHNIKYRGCAVAIFRIKKGFPEKPDYMFFPEQQYKVSVIEQMTIGDSKFLGCLIPHNTYLEKNKTLTYCKNFIGKILKCKFEENILETFYQDWLKGMPVVNRNYAKAVNILDTMKFDNLIFAGDYTTLFPSMDSAVQSGKKAQKRLEQFKF